MLKARQPYERRTPPIAHIVTYDLHFKSGHHKKATRVVFADGVKVDFMDKLSKKEAVRQAPMHYARIAGRQENPWRRYNPTPSLAPNPTREVNTLIGVGTGAALGAAVGGMFGAAAGALGGGLVGAAASRGS